MRIGVDLISGENDIREMVKGCFDALLLHDYITDLEVVIIGRRALFQPIVEEEKSKVHNQGKKNLLDRISYIEASEVITMDDSPMKVIKQKKDSSIIVGLEAHKNMEIDAFFSPGNTGAIVVASSFILGRVKGVKRPALPAYIPNIHGESNVLLDVGASAECNVKDLLKFAVMGRILARTMNRVENPRVGLLNIGTEEHKGTSIMRATYKRLEELDVNFIGNVEGNDIFGEKADVILCDGQLGNTTLKVAEGAAKTLNKVLKDSILSSKMATLSLPLYKAALKEMKDKIDPDSKGGSPLLGVQGNVFIGHGKSGRRAVKNAILACEQAVRGDVVGAINRRLHELHI